MIRNVFCKIHFRHIFLEILFLQITIKYITKLKQISNKVFVIFLNYIQFKGLWRTGFATTSPLVEEEEFGIYNK